MTASVTARLRASTRHWHDALEATGFAVAMLAGALPLERYVGQLAAYRVVLEALEDELSRSGCPAVARVWSADLVKVPLIDSDLRHFAGAGTAPVALADGAARRFAEEIRRTGAEAPEDLLGFLYVLEGSTLGALYLRRHVCAAYHLADAGGIAYYSSGDRARWTRLTALMDEALADAEAQDRVIAAAGRAYHHTSEVSEALAVGLPVGA